MMPVEILDDWVKGKAYPPPEWSPNKKKVVIDGKSYTLGECFLPTI